jgi:hypothetical protein
LLPIGIRAVEQARRRESDRRPPLLARGLAFALTIAQLAFLHGFGSVWCFLSTLLSMLVLCVGGWWSAAVPAE